MDSIMTFAQSAGTLFSLFFLMPLAETKGRKYTVIYLRFLMTVISSLCQLTAALLQASELFMIGQFLNGCQYAIKSFVTLIYVMECAPDKYRGFTSTALFFSDVLAQLFMYSVASPNVFGNANTWFLLPLFVLISSVFILVLNLRLPESPKWLVCQNRIDEAGRAVTFYHGKDCDLKELLTSYIREKNLTTEDKISIKQLWENDTMREALKIVLAVTAFLVVDSSSVQYTYNIFFYTEAGYTVQEAMNINFIMVIVLAPTKFIGTYIIDALGRRPVMAIAGAMMYIKSWWILITQFILYFNGPSILTKVLYLAADVITLSSGATGVMTLSVLFISELFPPAARTAVAQCLFLSVMVTSVPIISLFPIINSIFAPAFFMPYVVTQVLIGIYLYRHMPETKARAVCDIIESLDKDVASRRESMLEEETPLLRNRARTVASKRNSVVLNTARTRALTVDHSLIPRK